MPVITIYTDGASRGNPGISVSGYSVFKDNKFIKNCIIENGIATNNFAEHNAIYNALEWCNKNIKDIKNYDVILYSDSQLAINQLNGIYKIKDIKLKLIYNKTKVLIKSFTSIKFINVRRTDINISDVDKMLNEYLDRISIDKPKN